MRRFYLNPPLFLFLCSAGFHSACATRLPVPASAVRSAEDSVERLRFDLEFIFMDPSFGSAQWGVEIVSLEQGQLLYERNSSRPYMPASNNKLLTSVAALVRLGPDYRFETRVLAYGDISDGVLKGNLVISGSGDPTTAPRRQN